VTARTSEVEDKAGGPYCPDFVKRKPLYKDLKLRKEEEKARNDVRSSLLALRAGNGVYVQIVLAGLSRRN
jgi:hypothetical protein